MPRTKGAKDLKPRVKAVQLHPKVKEVRTKRKQKQKKTTYATFEGHRLTVQEAKFIDNYIATGNGRQSVIDAGYKTSAPGQYSSDLLNKPHIKNEIDHRLKLLEEESIADATEILQYFTSVMRGEIRDQFDLEAPLGERTKAAQELAKRKIDIPNRLNGKEATAEVRIKLDWGGFDDESE